MEPSLTFLSNLSQLAWPDLLGLGLVAIFLVLGIVRGLWWQVIRLVGIVLAVVVARTLSPVLEPRAAELLPELAPRYAYGLVWITLFALSLTAAALLGYLGRKLLEAMQLGLVDRFGGAVAGAATGLIVHVALLAGAVQLAPAAWLQRNLADSWSEELLLTVGSGLPLVVTHAAGEEMETLLRTDNPER